MDDQPKTTRWTETHCVPSNEEQVNNFRRIVATKNLKPFRGFPAGEVVLESVKNGKKPQTWDFTFRQSSPGFSDKFRSTDFAELGIRTE